MELSSKYSDKISVFNDSEDSDGPKNNILSYLKKNNMNNNQKDLQNNNNINIRNNIMKYFNNINNEFENNDKDIINSYTNSFSINDNNNYIKCNIFPISNNGDFEVEINLDNNKKEKLNFNLGDDIHYKVDLFCQQKKYSKKQKNQILEQIKRHMNNIINYYENLKMVDALKIPIKKNKNSATKGEMLGQKLYEKCLLKKKIKEKKIEKMKRELSDSQISPELTFHPKLSKKSQEMTKDLNKNIKIEDRLIALGKEREKRLLKKIAINSFIEKNDSSILDVNKSELTYKPKINKYSLTRNKSEDIFSRLYRTAGIKKSKDQKLNEQYYKDRYPFKPTISKMSKNMKESKYNEVIKRFYDKEHQKRIKILKEHTPEPKKIRMKPKIYNNIYHAKKEKIENNKNNYEEINKQIKKINEKRKQNWCQYSNDIINHIKEIKFREIFDLLDRNKKKFISYSNISFYNIPDEIMPSLTPVIEEVNRNKYKKINYEEFKKLTDEPLSIYMKIKK